MSGIVDFVMKMVTHLNQTTARCKALNLCLRCTSNKHRDKGCMGQEGKLFLPCRACGSKGHISALFPRDTSLKDPAGVTRTVRRPVLQLD